MLSRRKENEGEAEGEAQDKVLLRPGKYEDLWLVWVVPYIFKGYKRPLDENEIPVVHGKDKTDFLASEADRLWNEQLKQGGPKNTSVVKILLKLQGFELYLGVFLSIVQGVLFSVARPLFLKKIIEVVSDESSTTKEGVTIAVAFAFVILVEGIVQAQVKQLLSCRLGTRYISWMSSLIHKKSTTVSEVAVGRAGLHESSLIGADVTRMVEDWRWMCLFPYILTALLGGICILAYILGQASLVGFFIMFSIAYVNYRLTKLIKKVEEIDFALGDERIGILREILDGVKAIKMMAWEIPFRDLINSKRIEETEYIRKFRSLSVTSINSGRASPILAACFSILTLAIVSPGDLTASTIFVAISSFQGLRLPLIAVPQHSAMLANTFVSFGRLRRYLLLDNAPPAEPLGQDSPVAVVVQNATFTWTLTSTTLEDDSTKILKKAKKTAMVSKQSTSPENRPPIEFKLHRINLQVRSSNHLIAVVGKVGSGKSSLLSAILGSMFIESGTVKITQSIAYVPQKPFIMSGTAIENVIMGHHYDEEKFKRVLHASALDVDLKHLPYGEQTEIGERGQTLSGGQAARLSIARALYHDAELLLVDDILAAVDPEVANNLFRRSILGFLGRTNSLNHTRGTRRSVLMTLNQLHLLPHFDHAIVLASDGSGQVVEQGTYAELLQKQNGTLAMMLDGVEAVQDDVVSHQLKAELDENTDEKTADVEMEGHGEENKENEHVETFRKHLVEKERGERGAVTFGTIREYTRAMGSYRLPLSFLFATLAYAFMAASDLYLANWIRRTEEINSQSEHLKNAAIYIALAICNVLGIENLSLHNTRSSVRASKHVHSMCIDRILHAPITWYEETPSGRLVSRFSGDLSMVDRQLAFIFDDCFQFFFLLMALALVVSYIVPELAPVIVIGFGLFAWQVVAVDRANREIKRYANIALSPILTNISETINARELIRCMQLESFFCQRHFSHVDRYTSFLYMSYSLVNFSTLMAGFVSFILSSGAALVVVFRRESYDPALVGLSITYAMLTPYFLSILSVVLPVGFAALTSLERVLELKSDRIPQEPAWEMPRDQELLTFHESAQKRSEVTPLSLQKRPSGKIDVVNPWPTGGKIEFQEVILRYRPELPPALKGISMIVNGGEKIGLVGRTGSGKSTLAAMSLFRVHELTSGRILLDGQDISQIGLQLLRKSLTIIPQQPLLLKRGSLRRNLDPFGDHTDDELLLAMDKVGLRRDLLRTAEEEKSEGNSLALSVGERQLLSLARAILRKSGQKVIVLDEPTSSLDIASDEHIQKVVRSAFSSSTVLMIAHRLGSIIESDRVATLSQGVLVEFDHPDVLLSNPDGLFTSMVAQLGPNSERQLREKALRSRLSAENNSDSVV